MDITLECMVLYQKDYPVNDEKNSALYGKYKELTEKEDKVIFGGRLGEYKYYDMDQVIAAALECCERKLL